MKRERQSWDDHEAQVDLTMNEHQHEQRKGVIMMGGGECMGWEGCDNNNGGGIHGGGG